MAKLQTQLHNRATSPAITAELQELRSQLRSAQTLAAQQRQEAFLYRGGSGSYDTADLDIDHGGSTPRLLSPRPSFSARQGVASSRRGSGGSGGSPLNPRVSMSGMQVVCERHVTIAVCDRYSGPLQLDVFIFLQQGCCACVLSFDWWMTTFCLWDNVTLVPCLNAEMMPAPIVLAVCQDLFQWCHMIWCMH